MKQLKVFNKEGECIPLIKRLQRTIRNAMNGVFSFCSDDDWRDYIADLTDGKEDGKPTWKQLTGRLV